MSIDKKLINLLKSSIRECLSLEQQIQMALEGMVLCSKCKDSRVKERKAPCYAVIELDVIVKGGTLKLDHKCDWCGAVLFKEEVGFCLTDIGEDYKPPYKKWEGFYLKHLKTVEKFKTKKGLRLRRVKQ